MNYYYTQELIDVIKGLIADVGFSGDDLKKISEGNFTSLPFYDKLHEHIPAIMIDCDSIQNAFANEALDILYSRYNFQIMYIVPYKYKSSVATNKRAKEVANKISSVLTRDRLKGLIIESDEENSGGYVAAANVTDINYNSAVNNFLSDVGLELYVVTIDFNVEFRTYERMDRV